MNKQANFEEQQIDMWNLMGVEKPDGEYMELTDGRWRLQDTVGNTKDSPCTPIKTKLSDILQHNVNEKYRLSEKACQGILRRAELRGKELPKVLRDALLCTAGNEWKDTVFSKTAHPRNAEEGQGWVESDISHTLNLFTMCGEMRADELVVQSQNAKETEE